MIRTLFDGGSDNDKDAFRWRFVRPSVKDVDDLNRGSYMSAHVLLNLLNELGKRDKMRGLPSILSLFRNEFNKFNNTRARMLDSIYHMTLEYLKIAFLV